MGQLTEQFIRVRAKPFIVEVDQQEQNIEQKMFVSLFSIAIPSHCSIRFFSAKPMQQWKKGLL